MAAAMASNPRIPFVLSSERRRLPPFEGKRLIVNVALNLEHWPFDKPMPRQILSSPKGNVSIPDVPNFSWVEYGLRCGVPRILEIMSSRGLVGTALMNSSLADVYPSCAEAFVAKGWEIVGHGVTQCPLTRERDPAGIIQQCLDRLTRLSGRPVRGWLGPGLAENADTPDLLKQLGVDYVHDWTVDDLPCWMRTLHGPMIALPYTLELNDVPIFAIEGLSSDEILKRVLATVEQFDSEASPQPRIITLALHPHIIGVAHRARFLAQVLDLLLSRSDTVFTTSGCIADWYEASEPPDLDIS